MLFYHLTKGDASEDESHQLEGSEDSDGSYFGDSEDDLSEMFSKGNFRKLN